MSNPGSPLHQSSSQSSPRHASNSPRNSPNKHASSEYISPKQDRFRCIKIEARKYGALSTDDLSSKIAASLPGWISSGVRGVWAKIDLKHSYLIPAFAHNGFVYHHAQPEYVMMKRWISQTEPDTLPPYANQYLGAGGFVVNEENQLLVVKERFSVRPHWKLPGGHADKGEHVGEAAQREVYEETGVTAQFQCVIAFRHQHNYRHGCSDFYFVCLLKPITHTINYCRNEIAEAKWMDLEEYVNSPDVSDGNRYFAQCYLKMIQGNRQLRPVSFPNFYQTGTDLIYSIQDTHTWETPGGFPSGNSNSQDTPNSDGTIESPESDTVCEDIPISNVS